MSCGSVKRVLYSQISASREAFTAVLTGFFKHKFRKTSYLSHYEYIFNKNLRLRKENSLGWKHLEKCSRKKNRITHRTITDRRVKEGKATLNLSLNKNLFCVIPSKEHQLSFFPSFDPFQFLSIPLILICSLLYFAQVSLSWRIENTLASSFVQLLLNFQWFFYRRLFLFKHSEKCWNLCKKTFSTLLDFIKHCHNIFLPLGLLTQTLFAIYQATVHCYSVRKLSRNFK